MQSVGETVYSLKLRCNATKSVSVALMKLGELYERSTVDLAHFRRPSDHWPAADKTRPGHCDHGGVCERLKSHSVEQRSASLSQAWQRCQTRYRYSATVLGAFACNSRDLAEFY